MLDFKIRELKQQIEPRQMEIMAMREKIKEMDTELERYHKSNAALDTLIGDLRAKIDALQAEVKGKRMQAKALENTIETCRSDVQTAIAHIQTHPTLVQHVKTIVATYGSMENVRPRIDPEVEAEYARHREYLQRTILELKQALEEGSVHHMTVNNQIRQNNMTLIGEINAQRDSNRALKNHVQAEIGRIRHYAQALNMKKSKARVAGGGAGQQGSHKDVGLKLPAGLFANDNSLMDGGDTLEPGDLLDKNRRRITALRAAIAALENRSRSMMQKAMSREVLPPLDGGVVHLPNIHGSQKGGVGGGAGGGIAMESGVNTPGYEGEEGESASQRKKSLGHIELPPVNRPVKQPSVVLDMGDSIYSPGEYPPEHLQVAYSPDSNPGGTYTTQYVEPADDNAEEPFSDAVEGGGGDMEDSDLGFARLELSEMEGVVDPAAEDMGDFM